MPSETKLRVYGRLAPQANSNGAQTHGVSSTLGAVYRGLNFRSFHVSYGSGYIMYVYLLGTKRWGSANTNHHPH